MTLMSLKYRGLDIEIDYDYEKGEPMVWNYGDGSGYPGMPDSVEINKITLGEEDLTDFLLNELNEGYKIEEAMFKQFEKDDEDEL